MGGGGGHGWRGGVLGFARKFKLARYLMCQPDSWFRVLVRIPIPQGTGGLSSVDHTRVQYYNRNSWFNRLSNPVRSKWVCPFLLPWFYSIARVWPGIPSLARHWQKEQTDKNSLDRDSAYRAYPSWLFPTKPVVLPLAEICRNPRQRHQVWFKWWNQPVNPINLVS